VVGERKDLGVVNGSEDVTVLEALTDVGLLCVTSAPVVGGSREFEVVNG
jgi:energy-converting hydrogenase Eha subunit H